jgi:L-alanine-DL-glutamate epimerase-like enolase superfamily enzyme
MDLPKIRKASQILIMADESCCDHNDAKRLIDISACDLINVKLGKSAGIFDALKIVSVAEKENVKIQVGGFLESRLAFTAAAHFALKSDIIIYYDFDTPLMFTEDPVTGGISYDPNGIMNVPETPGLGAGIDLTFLKKQEKIILK